MRLGRLRLRFSSVSRSLKRKSANSLLRRLWSARQRKPLWIYLNLFESETMQRSPISSAEAERLVEIARAASGGSDFTCVLLLLSLVASFAQQSAEMRAAPARELLALARRLD